MRRKRRRKIKEKVKEEKGIKKKESFLSWWIEVDREWKI